MAFPDRELRPHLKHNSSLQTGLDEIALIERLREEGIHAHSLLKNDETPDAFILKEIDHVMHDDQSEAPQNPAFLSIKGALARRRSRENARRITRRFR